MQAAVADVPVMDASQLPSDERTGGKSSALPTQVISFAIGDDQYGVDIMAVREIKGWSEITHLPRQPAHVRGVLNLRGVMVPRIMDGPLVQAAVDIRAGAAREWVMGRLLGETQKGDRKGAPLQ